MPNTGSVNAHLKSRAPALLVEVEIDGIVFEVTLRHEWNTYNDNVLEQRALIVFREARDRHPAQALLELDRLIAEPLISEIVPLPPLADDPGQRYLFQLAGQPAENHILRITLEASALLPFEERWKVCRQTAEQILCAWFQLNQITDANQVPETIIVTTKDVTVLIQYLAH